MKTIRNLLVIVGMAAASAHGAAIHHWSFDADGSDSVGSNTATASGVTFTTTGGAFGGYLADTSANDYAGLASDVTLLASTTTDTDGWTVAFWMNNWSINDMIMGNRDTGNGGVGASAMFTRDNLTDFRLQIRDIADTAGIVAAGVNLDNTDNWTHFAQSREADGTMTLWINGTAYTQPADGVPPLEVNQLEDFTINAFGVGTASNSSNFVGDLDEVWIFDSALNSSEISNLISNNNIVPEPSALMLVGLSGLFCLRRRR